MTPLEGITVLDFSHALAGPYCTMLMAAYGARVIKVESPSGGDVGRTWAPPLQGGEASYFIGVNSGKESLAIDLKTPEGLEACRKLAAKADILIENMRPGTMKRLGLGYDALEAANPRLIYVSVSGYGQTGPRRDEPAMDLVMQAASGLMSITGTTSGEVVRSGHSIGDLAAGMFALIGAQMALEARHRTGRGQFVDVSMFDSLISTMAANFGYFFGNNIVPKPLGTGFIAIVPYSNFPCADRDITIAVASDKLWEAFCRAIGRTDLTNHELYCSNPLRVTNRKTLEPLLTSIFRTRPAAEWVEALSREGIPCTLVRNFQEIADDPQTAERNMLPLVDHATAGKVRVTGVPVKLSETPGRITRGAPLLGADTEHILRELS